MKPIAEQISSFENKRAASSARMQEIMSKSADEGRTLDETETQEYDALQAEVKQLTNEIDSIGARTNFNGIKLLDGSAKKVLLQTGSRAGETVSFAIGSTRASDLGTGRTAALTVSRTSSSHSSSERSSSRGASSQYGSTVTDPPSATSTWPGGSFSTPRSAGGMSGTPSSCAGPS